VEEKTDTVLAELGAVLKDKSLMDAGVGISLVAVHLGLEGLSHDFVRVLLGAKVWVLGDVGQGGVQSFDTRETEGDLCHLDIIL
jgi:hypothetical protein